MLSIRHIHEIHQILFFYQNPACRLSIRDLKKVPIILTFMLNLLILLMFLSKVKVVLE